MAKTKKGFEIIDVPLLTKEQQDKIARLINQGKEDEARIYIKKIMDGKDKEQQWLMNTP